MSHPDEDAIARVHQILLSAAALLCPEGAGIMLRSPHGRSPIFPHTGTRYLAAWS